MASERPSPINKPPFSDVIPSKPNPTATTTEVARVKIEGGRRRFSFTVMLGDITRARVAAIVCPTGSQLNAIFSTGVSGAIQREAGDEPFEKAQEMLHQLSPEAQQEGLRFGGAIAVPSGTLRERGIQHIIFTNVFPPSGQQVDSQGLSVCVTSAALEANRMGADSLAIPAMRSGSFEPVSLRDSIKGVLTGIQRYGQLPPEDVGSDVLEKLSLVLYYKPTAENVYQVQHLLRAAIQSPGNQLPGK